MPLLYYRFVLLFLVISLNLIAQDPAPVHCGTMHRLENRVLKNPLAKSKFETKREAFNKIVRERSMQRMAAEVGVVYTIPVVFHIVMANPNQVSDATIRAQLDTLNKSFRGLNGDSVKIPAWFKPLFGKSGIAFCLAQRTPAGEVTTGIERIVTSEASFNLTTDRVKRRLTGGADSWDESRYLNVWICLLANNTLGYATFPEEDTPGEQGVVVDYRSLPGGAYTNYNSGKTLVHETGHFFNLYHIWGDDNGNCNGTDLIGDTPNQGISTAGCYTGIRTDNCTTSGNGIMYQNFMDYSYDACLVLFTHQQVARMEQALTVSRASLLNSNGCKPVVNFDYDAALVSINEPAQRLCNPVFIPSITIRNVGSEVLTSAIITVKVDNAVAYTYTWTGALATLASTTFSLNAITSSIGNHQLAITVTNPSNQLDEDPSNNEITNSFQYYLPVTELAESFEGNIFPPPGWDIVNSDKATTWMRVFDAAKSGVASAAINNYNYGNLGQRDDLRLPDLTLSGIDSAFLSFQVAASAIASTNNAIINRDTLEIVLSTDCGRTYQVVYRKWDSSLSTAANSSNTSFIPTSIEWRKDSVDLSPFIGSERLLVAFRNVNKNQNNVYIDDVKLRKVTVNPNLKLRGILVTPNPTVGAVAVQFYPQPVNLRAIQIFNTQGQKLIERLVNINQANNYYAFDMAGWSPGMYIVRIVFTDGVETRKIIKH